MIINYNPLELIMITGSMAFFLMFGVLIGWQLTRLDNKEKKILKKTEKVLTPKQKAEYKKIIIRDW